MFLGADAAWHVSMEMYNNLWILEYNLDCDILEP